jgi:hypothetical protein
MPGSFKSVLTDRVDTSKAWRMAAARLQGGDPSLCPAGGAPYYDEYGRPATIDTITLKAGLAPECGWSSTRTAGRLMNFEVQARNLPPVCAPGFRGGGDTMLGSARDVTVTGIYGPAGRSPFVRQFPGRVNMAPDFGPAPRRSTDYPDVGGWRPWSRSMDATISTAAPKAHPG